VEIKSNISSNQLSDYFITRIDTTELVSSSLPYKQESKNGVLINAYCRFCECQCAPEKECSEMPFIYEDKIQSFTSKSLESLVSEFEYNSILASDRGSPENDFSYLLYILFRAGLSARCSISFLSKSTKKVHSAVGYVVPVSLSAAQLQFEMNQNIFDSHLTIGASASTANIFLTDDISSRSHDPSKTLSTMHDRDSLPSSSGALSPGRQYFADSATMADESSSSHLHRYRIDQTANLISNSNCMTHSLHL